MDKHSILVRILQRNKTNRWKGERDICSRNCILEAKESHNLLSARWKTRKADDVMQFQSEGQDPGAPNSEARRRWTSQVKKRKRLCHSSILLFYSSPQWIRSCPFTLVRKNIFNQPIVSNANIFGNTFTDAPTNYVLPSYMGIL